MAHYHEPPATLTKAEWDRLAAAFMAAKQEQAFKKLREANNAPHRAGDLFSAEDVYSKGQDQFNDVLRKANSVFALGRVDHYANCSVATVRENRMLALVRRPKK